MNAMMKALAVGLALLSPAGCKFVKNEPAANTEGQAAADPDDVLVAGILKDTYESRLLPLIRDKAVDAPTLVAAIRADLAGAGKRYGNKGAGEGAPWAFAVRAKGIVVAEDRKSRAAKAEIDVDGDGKADLTVQLGPVVKGTALRDVAPFYVFTEFRDQIQFAKLSRALNDRTVGALGNLPGSLIGRTLALTGVFSVASAGAPILVTPVSIEVLP